MLNEGNGAGGGDGFDGDFDYQIDDSNEAIQQIIADEAYVQFGISDPIVWSGRFNFTRTNEPLPDGQIRMVGEGFSLKTFVRGAAKMFGNGHTILSNVPLTPENGSILEQDLLDEDIPAMEAAGARTVWEESFDAMNGPVFVFGASQYDPSPNQLSIFAVVYVKTHQPPSKIAVKSIAFEKAYAVFAIGRRDDPTNITLRQATLSGLDANQNRVRMNLSSVFDSLQAKAFDIFDLTDEEVHSPEVAARSPWSVVYPPKPDTGTPPIIVNPPNPGGSGRR